MGLSSHLLKMKLIVASLLLVALVSAQDSRSVRERVKGQVRQWASIQAHCAEASNTEGSIQPEVALQCKKCQAGVGDWNTAEGFQRGKACLETYEPKTMAVCGDLFQEYEDSGYDVSYTSKMVECWENTYMRDIAGKCMEATGGEDVNLALLCVFKHLTDNHKHAETVLLGSSDENEARSRGSGRRGIFREGQENCFHVVRLLRRLPRSGLQRPEPARDEGPS